MKTLVNRKSFVKALELASKAAPRKSFKAILSCVRFTADPENGSTFEATDLELGVRVGILGVKVDEPGSVILDAAKVLKVFKASKDEELAITVSDDKLIIRGLSTSGTFPVEHKPEEFPCVPVFVSPTYLQVARDDMAKLINRTIHATDPEAQRYAMSGVLAETDVTSGEPERLTFVATDGRRLARQSVPADFARNKAPICFDDSKATPEPQTIIPVKTLKVALAIAKTMSDRDIFAVAFTKDAWHVRAGMVELYSRLVAGRFPRHADCFPSNRETRIRIQSKPFLNAIESARPFLTDETRGLDLATLGSECVTVKMLDSFQTELVSHRDSGADFDITLDGNYLRDFAKVVQDVSDFTMDVIDHKNPMVFRTFDGLDYLIMPLTRPDAPRVQTPKVETVEPINHAIRGECVTCGCPVREDCGTDVDGSITCGAPSCIDRVNEPAPNYSWQDAPIDPNMVPAICGGAPDPGEDESATICVTEASAPTPREGADPSPSHPFSNEKVSVSDTEENNATENDTQEHTCTRRRRKAEYRGLPYIARMRGSVREWSFDAGSTWFPSRKAAWRSVAKPGSETANGQYQPTEVDGIDVEMISMEEWEERHGAVSEQGIYDVEAIEEDEADDTILDDSRRSSTILDSDLASFPVDSFPKSPSYSPNGQYPHDVPADDWTAHEWMQVERSEPLTVHPAVAENVPERSTERNGTAASMAHGTFPVAKSESRSQEPTEHPRGPQSPAVDACNASGPCCTPSEPEPCKGCANPVPVPLSPGGSKLPAPIHASLTLTIDRTTYGLSLWLGQQYNLEKSDGTLYEIDHGPIGWQCTCPDFVNRHAGLHTIGCRHVRALRNVGLLDIPKSLTECPDCLGLGREDEGVRCERCGGLGEIKAGKSETVALA